MSDFFTLTPESLNLDRHGASELRRASEDYLADPRAIAKGLDYEFARMLGIVTEYRSYERRDTALDKPTPEIWLRFFRALRGPYKKFLMKEYRIRNGLE